MDGYDYQTVLALIRKDAEKSGVRILGWEAACATAAGGDEREGIAGGRN